MDANEQKQTKTWLTDKVVLDESATEEELLERIHLLEDALSHIAKVCYESRTNTRQLRWIAMRSQYALSGGKTWKTVYLPKHDKTK